MMCMECNRFQQACIFIGGKVTFLSQVANAESALRNKARIQSTPFSFAKNLFVFLFPVP